MTTFEVIVYETLKHKVVLNDVDNAHDAKTKGYDIVMKNHDYDGEIKTESLGASSIEVRTFDN